MKIYANNLSNRYIFLVVAIGLFAGKYKYLKIEEDGENVQMKIQKIPSSCIGTKVNHYATFAFNGEQFIKKIGADFCSEHNIGDIVEMKFLHGYNVILFPYEPVKRELVILAILGLFGLAMIVKAGGKKKRR